MQNNNIKISIIMPVYNVENYLPRAIESVLGQSLTEFEFFLINDGSTDNSYNICKKYEELDNRIIVINQNNAGAHSARNVAIKKAKGKYVCFFDSDDYVDNNMLYELYNLATNNKSDMVVSGFYIHTYYNDNDYITLDYIPNIDCNKDIEVYNNKNSFRINAYKHFDKNMFYSPWNKLYNLEYLNKNNIIFPNTYRDDFPFVMQVIKDISNVTFTKKQYYHFIRKRADSETQKYVSNLYDKREEEHKLMLDLYKYWGLINDKKSYEMINRRYIDRLFECMTNLYNSECKLSNKEKIKFICDYIHNSNVDEAIKFSKPKKLYLKLMYIPIKLKSTNLCILMSKCINYIKNKNIKLFSILKTNR